MEKANYGIVHSAEGWTEEDVNEFVKEYVNDYVKSLTS